MNLLCWNLWYLYTSMCNISLAFPIQYFTCKFWHLSYPRCVLVVSCFYYLMMMMVLSGHHRLNSSFLVLINPSHSLLSVLFVVFFFFFPHNEQHNDFHNIFCWSSSTIYFTIYFRSTECFLKSFYENFFYMTSKWW